jgi:outer membrane lipoprotein-sorting protein
MYHFRIFCLFTLAVGLVCIPLPSQTQTQPETKTAKDLTPEQIIKAFSAKETEFYQAWMQYTYHQTAKVQVLSVNGIPKDEKMTTVADIVFNDNGSREIQVRRRTSNLRSVTYTLEDEEVINNLQPFALTENELPQYDLKYIGKEKVDDLNCYVFSVSPKSYKGKKLYFQGKIWVDDRDLQIVRTVGKPVPQKKDNLFPDFETIRQMIDGQYWFPIWTHAESKLRFSQETVHIEETINYEDYKKFASRTTIQFGTPVN